jgi:hypothetical protein
LGTANAAAAAAASFASAPAQTKQHGSMNGEPAVNERAVQCTSSTGEKDTPFPETTVYLQ